MYFYKFGYSSEEDSRYIELKHEKKFSDEEFEDLVVKATVEVLINRRPHWASGPEEGVYTKEFLETHRRSWRRTDKEIKEQHRCNVYFRFPDIMDNLKECLIEEYGFEKVEYESYFSIFGWQGLVDEEDNWGGKEDPLFTKIRETYKVKKAAKDINTLSTSSKEL